MQRLHRLVPGPFLPIVALTVILLLLVRLPPWEYEPVQSLRIFRTLPLYAALYNLWLIFLLLLLWRTRSLLLGAALVYSFVLVHIGTFVSATPYGAGEDWLKAFDVALIQHTGNMDPLLYRDFPALALLAAFVSTVCDVDFLTFRTPLLLIWLAILSTLLFVGYFRIFRSVPLGALAALLAVQSNIILARFCFHPVYMGVLLVVALLSFLSARQQPLSMRERLVLILFMSGLAITHFVSSVVGLVIIVGYHLERRWRKRPEVISQWMATLAMTLVLAWGVYWATQTFPNLVALLPKVDDQFRQGIAFFTVGRVTTANVEGLPLWVTAVQTFWWVAVYLAGGVIALVSLSSQHKRFAATAGYAGAYVVLVGATVVGTIISPGGYDFYRMVVYGSFLAAPLVLCFLLADRRGWILPLAVSGMFLILSFPTLLAHNTAISLYATHPPEVAAGQFLSRELEGTENVPWIYTETYEFWYHSPSLRDQRVLFHPDLALVSEQELRDSWPDYIHEFVQEGVGGSDAVFLLSFEQVIHWRHLLGIPTNDPLWSETRQALSRADLIYDAGGVQLFRSASHPLKTTHLLPSSGAVQWDRHWPLEYP